MNRTDVKKIYGNYKDLVDHVDINEIKDYLYANIDEFTNEEMELVENEITKSAKMRRLLRILKTKKSPDVLHHFCQSLKKSQVKAYETMANLIVNTDVTDLELIEDNDEEDASVEEKIDKLSKQCLDQSRILQGVSNKVDCLQQLSGVKEFTQLSGDGKRIVNENIERFSEYSPHTSVTLKLKPEKKMKYDPITAIACLLGEDALSTPSSSSLNEYVKAMRTSQGNIGTDTRQEINNCIESLHILEIVGFPTVETIARELFSNCNWGRIVVWFAFWRQLAEHFEGTEEECRLFGNFVGFQFASMPECREWINKNGGWDTVLRIKPRPFLRKFLDYFGFTFLS